MGWFLLANTKDSAARSDKRRRAKLAQIPPAPYTCHTIPKRSGEARTLYAPNVQLKWVQRRILEKILMCASPHDAAHGFSLGRSTRTNALPHVGRALLLKFDLEDFFPTITYKRVLGFFVSLGYPYADARTTVDDDGTNVAPILARLCCVAVTKERGVLPQGAPTSPTLANLLCRRLDGRLTGLAARFGGAYTRYADDLTFSFVQPDSVRIGAFRTTVRKICRSEGFVVNEAKFRVIRAHRCQRVTGVVVNDKPNIPRELRRAFRAMLHNCETHGVAAAAAHPEFSIGYLQGFASYINMIRPDLGPDLLRRVRQVLADAERV